MTRDYGCQLVLSETVAATAEIDLTRFPYHEVRVRGREAPLGVRVIGDMAQLAGRNAATSSHGEPVTPS